MGVRRSIVAAVFLLVSAACSGDGSSGGAAPGDEASVVAAAAVARMGAYNGMGGAGYQFALINVVGVYGTAGSHGLLRTSPSSAPIGDDVRVAVEQALAPARVVWVDSQTAVVGAGPMLPTAREVGAVLTIGVPDINGSTAKVTTGMWCGGTCGTGGRFVLRKGDSGWSVTGTEGGSWIA